MKLTNKDMDAIGKVLLVIFCFLMFMFSIESNAQSFSVNKVDKTYIINFIDEFDDTYYINGDKVLVRANLTLSEKEYKQLIKDIKKTLKFKEHEIDRDNYAVIKFGWVNDSVWVYKNKRAFSAVKSDIEYLNSKL
tara:strand:+ start:1170 stop:1574 length:405 start_codon:yes stop_codon:yes gene_type:complete